MPNLFRLTERLHRHGACVAIQINHSGASAVPGRIEGNTPVSSSNVPSNWWSNSKTINSWRIYAIADKYADAARRAQMAGFDAVEIHGDTLTYYANSYHLYTIRELMNLVEV